MTSRLIIALTFILGLAFSAGASTFGHVALAHEVARQKLAYQTTWQHGKVGWSSSGSGTWVVENRELAYDGSGESSIMAPVATRGHANYAIEMTVQALDHSDYNGTYGFGIIFRSSSMPDMSPHYNAPDALGAGVIDTSAAIAGVYVYPENLARSDFDPGQSWHTYRVEVRGTSLKLFVDGQLAAQRRSTRFLSRSRVGIFSIDYGISVKMYRVWTL